MWGSPNRGITIYFAQKLSAKHRGQKSYGGKSLRGKKSSGAKVIGGKCSRGQKSSVVNVRGQMCRGGGGERSPAGKCLAGKSPRTVSEMSFRRDMFPYRKHPAAAAPRVRYGPGLGMDYNYV